MAPESCRRVLKFAVPDFSTAQPQNRRQGAGATNTFSGAQSGCDRKYYLRLVKLAGRPKRMACRSLFDLPR